MVNPNQNKGKQQELMAQLQMYEQQAQQLQQQLQAVEEALTEMNSLNAGLDEIKGGKDKEVLSPLGRGVFTKTKLISEELIVDVGDKNFVKKSIPETKKIIEDQTEKLEGIREELYGNLEGLEKEFTRLMQASQQ